LGSVWSIPACGGRERLRGADGKKLHSTQKPEELLKRVILASSRPGDLVLDPFLGSGTTAAVARLLHRNWIGIERETTYVEAAQRRIDAVIPLPDDDPHIASSPKQERVPFRALVEGGYLKPGDYLYLDAPDCIAVILPDGKLQVGEWVGSIHKLAARLKHVPSCNGWMHWTYVDESGERLLINGLREQVRLHE
jgi:modification methylase